MTPALKDMVAAGLVERLHDAESRSGETGRWRFIDELARSLDELGARVHRAGGIVLPVDSDD